MSSVGSQPQTSDRDQQRPNWQGLELAGARRWPSPIDPSRWFGVAGDRFYKIQLRDRPALARAQRLHTEYQVLQRCRGIPGIPATLGFERHDTMDILVMERLGGEPLSNATLGWTRFLTIMVRLTGVVLRLARRGVSHDDLTPDNILIAAHRVQLIDFDQATTGRPLRCLGRSLLGLRLGGPPVCNSLLAPVREHVQARLAPGWLRLLRGNRLGRSAHRSAALPDLPPGHDANVAILREAWSIAADSNANSPGVPIAYYELVVDGVRFPGERPWADRWRSLRTITDYRDKRILELGCNLALLSIFLLKDEGAAAALAVDRDQVVLMAAAKAAEAYGKTPEFAQVDLDRTTAWETALASFRPDVVFALNILNWVTDRARLLAFLGRFDEVIVEGHDRPLRERARLAAAGFDTVELVTTSERGRPVFRCRKG